VRRIVLLAALLLPLALPDFDPGNAAHVAHEREMNALLLRLLAPDRFCPTQL